MLIKLVESQDPSLSFVASESDIRTKRQRLSKKLGIQGTVFFNKINKHKNLEKQEEARLWNALVSQGKGVSYFADSPEANCFLYNNDLMKDSLMPSL